MSELLENLSALNSLNPLAAEMSLRQLRPLADAAGAAAWPEVAQFSDALLARYLESAVKRSERETVSEYYALLELNADAYRQEPEPAADPEDAPFGSLALVPQGRYDARNWTSLKARAEVPMHLESAFHAARKRNLMVDTVFEVLFDIQLRVSRQDALDWQLRAANAESGCDPDVARDLLRAWQTLDTLPPAIIRRVLKWSADPAVLRNWPAVTREADQLLRDHTLRRWRDQQDDRHAIVTHIRKAPTLAHSPRLVAWYQELLDELGETTACFVEQADAWRNDHQAWRQSVLERELARLELLAPPLLLLSDLYFAEPDGGWRFAMAMFGFSNRQRRHWQKCLEAAAKHAVIRFFLFDLRADRTPLETIRALTFGDEALEKQLVSELDLLSQRFDNVAQRDLVATALAPIYAGYRELPLRAAEVGRRYRAVMRLLHPDNLQNLLPDSQPLIAQVQPAILTLSTLAASARKFLNARQSNNPDLPDLVADDQAFIEDVRHLRTSQIRRILLPTTQ